MQAYSTIQEKAAEWEVSVRHVQYLCRFGKIEGVRKRAGVWFIPENAPIPVKNTKKSGAQGEGFRFVGTRSLIFNTALKLFATRGYDNVSFREIANNAGLRQTTIYNHFKSKQELLDTIYDFYCHHYIKERVSLADLAEDISEKTPSELIRCIKYEFKEEYREKMLDITSIILQRIGVDQRAREISKTLIVDEGIKYVEAVLDHAVETGKFLPFDTRIMAVFINAIRIFTLYYWIAEPSPENRAKMQEDEWTMYEYALKLLADS